MLRIFCGWLAAGVIFLALDAAWLTLMSGRLYRPIIGELMSGKVEPLPAICFYLLYISGLVFFAVWPAAKSGDYVRAVVHAVILGLIAYGTYDLTNQATLRVWSWKLTIADMVWGGFASGAAALAGTWAARLVGR